MKPKENKVSTKKQAKEDKPKINFEELIFNNLSNCQLIAEKTGYHFTTLNLQQKNLDVLSQTFLNFKYLTVIDISNNNVVDISILGQLPFLYQLNASFNNIKDIKSFQDEEKFKKIVTLNLSNNRISEFVSLQVPNLVQLNLSNNNIEKCETFEGHQKLEILDLSTNKIANCQTLNNMPQLKKLYLSNNKIKQVTGLEGLAGLEALHLRGNLIEQFEENFPNIENLKYLNLRENKFEKLTEFEKLQPLANLKTLIFSFNPLIPKNKYYLFETINKLLRLERINKLEITKNIKDQAFSFAEQKWKEELAEKLRLEAEELEKQKLAEEAENQES